jgi:two-component system phosphate regulon sensor histidine kinase PhoR
MVRTLIVLYAVVVFLSIGIFGRLLLPESPVGVWLIALLTGLTCMAPAWLVRWAYTQPVRELTDATRRIMHGDYEQKVYTISSVEYRDLARHFNDMMDRLAEQFAQVEEDRRQLRTILDGMVEGVVAIDETQQILFANEKAAQLLEFHPLTAIGRKFWEIVRHKSILALTEKALETNEAQRENLDWKGASTKSLALYIAPIQGMPGEGAILVIHDISELRRLERLRQEFVANVSHELKSPLAVIKACVETLLDGAVDDKEERGAFLTQINEHADRLHNLIIDLMSLARIEAGMESLEFELVDLAEAVADCFDRHRARATAKDQILEILPPDESAAEEMRTDVEALSQILDNLVDNAIKYTPNGGRIRVRWYGVGDQICMEVEDNGIGIPEEDLPRIFERFYRVDKARSRELGGTGLGLAIVKNLVKVLRGTAQARSTFGQGSTFTVCLPRTPS